MAVVFSNRYLQTSLEWTPQVQSWQELLPSPPRPIAQELSQPDHEDIEDDEDYEDIEDVEDIGDIEDAYEELNTCTRYFHTFIEMSSAIKVSFSIAKARLGL